jgi:hypothetical protein
VKRSLLVAVVLSLALAAPAGAKVWFLDMRGQTVRWDQRVTTEIAGCADAPGCGDVVGRHHVWLRRVGGRRTLMLGRIDDSGRLRFRVPRVSPGRYRLVAVEGGIARAASDAFRVSVPSSARDASARTP